MEGLDNPSGVTELPLLLKSAQDDSEATPSSSREPKAKVSCTSSELKFVTISHPDDIRRRKDVRTDIRRHVMKKIGQQRRRPKTQAEGRASSASSASSCSLMNQGVQHKVPPNNHTDTSAALGAPCMMLPLLWDFPIEANDRTVELVRFLNEQRSVYLPFRGIWFDIARIDKGAFHVTLGNAADLFLRVRGGSDPDRNPEMLQYYSLSVAHLRERLNSAVDSISDGMVAHILSHLCFCMRRQDWTAWKAHMGGLAAISRLRGGLTHLGRGVHTWILLSDLGGSIVYDTVPWLPLPSCFPSYKTSLENLPIRLQELLSRLGPNSIAVTQTIEALERVYFVMNEVNTKGHSPLFWHRDENAISVLGPCIHFLLSMPRLPENLDATLRLDELGAEMVRLISLCLMSRLKAMFSFNAPEKARLENKLSRFTVSYTRYLGGPYRDLKVWALVTASLLQNGGGRDVYLDEIRRDMAATGETDATACVRIAKDIIWFEVLGKAGADNLIRNIALCSDGPAG
ncbi:uncharacterized protein LY79DRAFT_570432 [Colletotrichum navitas]|uniref:Tachykinin family protein n=1 Tax=Colletotrichum navitas TaxID=681940 RepID=A0AAD8PMT0_9PEZI|nr:uncharacterized protein LY79DRAFT_570432 [Colletotrichum navitas]KAK1570117.1 hypothetical protein LY79DRAFT_570432 [Colletotrichum navitas]